ncbi:hypothetical protein [Pseudactinotalea sp. HY158]|uniref:hypothetical protein n=1 Tax=Pseudactinotalea sp. HY158 TaxID=2654547 RepID=UPI00129CFDF7|nr:hypothetical protein [Pseudactinotalea sp. HY158]QGH68106.1 hypothetical protein GCE65_00110 [Pseudactinotalea sp. HY158]
MDVSQHPSQQDHEPSHAYDARATFTTNHEEPTTRTGMHENGNIDDALTRMITSGAGALGIAAGAVLGTAVAGPPGAVAGAAAGALLQDGMKAVAGDVAARFTAQTEQDRMGSLYVLAQNQIVQRLNGGEQPRSESFFRPRERKNAKKLRSEADELLEGAFLGSSQSRV